MLPVRVVSVTLRLVVQVRTALVVFGAYVCSPELSTGFARGTEKNGRPRDTAKKVAIYIYIYIYTYIYTKYMYIYVSQASCD